MMNTKNKLIGAMIALLFLLVLSVAPASAVTWYWNKIGDPGDTPGTAQTPIGAGVLNTIVGNLYPALDTDVFKIYIPDLNTFATTKSGKSLSADNDTELYVLNAPNLAKNPFGESVPLIDELNPITGGGDVKPKSFQTGPVPLNSPGNEFAPSEIPQPVPEPASMLLMGAGLAGIAVRKLRRKFSSQALTNLS